MRRLDLDMAKRLEGRWVRELLAGELRAQQQYVDDWVSVGFRGKKNNDLPWKTSECLSCRCRIS